MAQEGRPQQAQEKGQAPLGGGPVGVDEGQAVPGVQISRFCASGLDAVNLAAAQIMKPQAMKAER